MAEIIKVISALLSALFLAFAAVPAQKKQPDCIRLHILADSDSAVDQAAKLAVRDAVLKIARELPEAGSKDAAREELLSKGAELQRAAEETLRARGLDYGAVLMTGEFDFPDRTYGETLYPAGRYEAIRIVLGSGDGHNWWCVMFPPLCVIEDEPGSAEYDEDGTLKFKSFFAELIRGLFG